MKVYTPQDQRESQHIIPHFQSFYNIIIKNIYIKNYHQVKNDLIFHNILQIVIKIYCLSSTHCVLLKYYK